MTPTLKAALAALDLSLVQHHDADGDSEGYTPNWAMRCSNAIQRELDPYLRRGRPMEWEWVLVDIGNTLDELPGGYDVTEVRQRLDEAWRAMAVAVGARQ